MKRTLFLLISTLAWQACKTQRSTINVSVQPSQTPYQAGLFSSPQSQSAQWRGECPGGPKASYRLTFGRDENFTSFFQVGTEDSHLIKGRYTINDSAIVFRSNESSPGTMRCQIQNDESSSLMGRRLLCQLPDQESLIPGCLFLQWFYEG